MPYVYDYSKLKGRITEKLGSQSNFAKKMKLSETTIYSKLNSKIEFKQSEIIDACKLLDIPEDELRKYFFTQLVKKNATKERWEDGRFW